MSEEDSVWKEFPGLIHDIRDGLSFIQIFIIAIGAATGTPTSIGIAFIIAFGIQGIIWMLNPVRWNMRMEK